MSELLIAFVYLLIGYCWKNIAEEFVFRKTGMTSLHKIVSFILWPLEIFVGGMSG